MTLEEALKALEEATASIERLEKKNGELIAEKRKARGAEDGKLAELEAKLDDLSEANRKLERQLKAAADEKAKTESELGEKLKSRSSLVQRLVRDDALTKELVAAGVFPESLDYARTFLGQSIVVDEEKGTALAVLQENGAEVKKSVADFVKAWATTPAAQRIISANQGNSGGGAGGPGGPGGAPNKISLADFDKMPAKDQAAFMAKGGTLIEG